MGDVGDAGIVPNHPAGLKQLVDDYNLIKEGSFIGGNWVTGKSTFPVYDPATNEAITHVANMGIDDFVTAVDHADKEFQVFSKTSEYSRAQMLRNWAALIQKHHSDLSKILTMENGKTLPEARGEVSSSAAMVSWFAEEAVRSYGDVLPSSFPGSMVVTLKQPIGVCGIIAPWNFPMSMITRNIAPAIAAGCTVVIKPPSEAPLSALAITQLAVQAGIPPNAIQVVTTKDRTAVEQVYTNPKIKKVSFTGSTNVGKSITEKAAKTMKKVSMELGGNACFIVFDDADIDHAVDSLLECKFRCSGQTCICANRVFLQNSISQVFLSKLVSKVSNLKVGSGFDSAVTNGPLINKAAVRKTRDLIDDALAKGADLLVGGNVRADLLGNYIEPAVIANITSEMLIYREEIFGPVAPIFVFNKEDEMIKIANDTEFGLAGYFFSRDYQRIWRVSRALDVGMVGANTHRISEAGSPFGGVKESGYGKEGSRYGIAEYQILKSVTMGGATSDTS